MNPTPLTRYRKAKFWERLWLAFMVASALGAVVTALSGLHIAWAVIDLAMMLTCFWYYHDALGETDSCRRRLSDYYDQKISTSDPRPDH